VALERKSSKGSFGNIVLELPIGSPHDLQKKTTTKRLYDGKNGNWGLEIIGKREMLFGMLS